MRVIVWGASGQMGRLACQAVIERGHELVGRVTQTVCELAPADVIIDFSTPDCIAPLLDYALAKHLPVVIATTGHSREQQASIDKASGEIPILQAANFSLGMNLLLVLVEQAARIMRDSDIEIIETHHRRKRDAPSGSAKELVAAVERALGAMQPTYGRSGVAPRRPQEIGVHAIRGGDIVGKHEIYFITDKETLTLSHAAHDRSVYAVGAVKAAEYLYRQPPGYYTVRSLLGI